MFSKYSAPKKGAPNQVHGISANYWLQTSVGVQPTLSKRFE
jgi:hypothetical protein